MTAILTILSLLIAAVLPWLSIYQLGKQRFIECNYDSWQILEYEETGSYKTVLAKFHMFVPQLIAALVLLLWCILTPDPAALLDSYTPSFSTNNWLWTAVVWFFCGLPIGSLGAMMFHMAMDIRPKTVALTVLVVVPTLAAVLWYGWIMCHVYSPWIIYIPLLWPIGLSLAFLWPETRLEAKDSNIRMEKKREEDEARSRRWEAELAAKRQAREAREAAQRAARVARNRAANAFPKVYNVVAGGKSYVLTQDSPYSAIDYTDQEGGHWAYRDGSFTYIG